MAHSTTESVVDEGAPSRVKATSPTPLPMRPVSFFDVFFFILVRLRFRLVPFVFFLLFRSIFFVSLDLEIFRPFVSYLGR